MDFFELDLFLLGSDDTVEELASDDESGEDAAELLELALQIKQKEDYWNIH